MSERVITIYSPCERQIGDFVKVTTPDGGNVYGKVLEDFSNNPKYTARVHDVRCSGDERKVNLGKNYYNVRITTFLHR